MNILLLLLLTFPSLAFAFSSGNYTLDPMHSRMSFIIKHFVISEVEGRFDEVSGEIVLKDKFSDSTFSAEIPVKSINTGVTPRDKHLKSSDFFDEEKFPKMTFKSTKIKGNKEDFHLTGILTIKNVSKEVKFKLSYTGSVVDPQGKTRVAFKGEAKINRKDFNINYNEKISIGNAVGDEVKIRLWTEAIKK